MPENIISLSVQLGKTAAESRGAVVRHSQMVSIMKLENETLR